MEAPLDSEDLNLQNRKVAILDVCARQLRQPPSPLASVLDQLLEFVVGGEGNATPATLSAAVEAHVADRFQRGCTIDSVANEYGVLRRAMHTALRNQRFDHAVDIALAHAMKHYLQLREELRERFIGVLAHDLRTPIASLTMATEMLGAPERTTHEKSLLDLMLDSSDRMRRMINEVLSWARTATNGEMPIQKTPEDMSEILLAVTREARMEHGRESCELQLEGNLAGQFDRDRVHQAVMNLVRNAIEHGTGTAHVAAREAEDGACVILTVRNRGALRSPAASSIASPFRARRPSGSRGLGLYIVDQVVRGHRGSLDIASSLDETTVTIRWPTARFAVDAERELP